MWKPIFAIALGSVLGGLLRWSLGLKLNSLFPTVPLGTLSANLIAGYVVGIAVAYFAQAPGIAPEWRLLGFCRISERRRGNHVNCGARTQDESTCSTSKGCAFL